MNWKEHIATDPEVCHGRPCIKRTRILVSTVLDNLADGTPIETLVEEYEGLTEESIRACLAYAADLAHGRYLDLPV